MIIVDSALEKRRKEGNPVRVGMVGAGFMGRGIALQIASCVPGMRLVAFAHRRRDGARRAYIDAGISNPKIVKSVDELEKAIGRGDFSITEDPMILCEARVIDAIIEVTGTIEYGVGVVLRAIENHKHVIMMNAELDGTIGPILKVYADKAGVVITNVDGDQPGGIMNLYPFVKGFCGKSALCGNHTTLQE